MAPRDRNYYELLGVSPDASREQIHSAYRKLARQHHPDVNVGGAARFHEVTDAYEVLHDPAQRARYDRSAARGQEVVRARHSATPRAPFFSATRRSRAVPRFLDEEPGGLGLGFGRGRRIRVQFVVRWFAGGRRTRGTKRP